ncbi:cytochrome P450 [Trametopsis cervina]|nr:cytochrome P450 [Trametopsis cervina]
MAHINLPVIGHGTTSDATLVVIVFGLVAHWVFRRWDPFKFLPVASLLIAPPALLSLLFVRQHGILYATLLSFFIYFSSLLISLVIYRLSPFHPLASYPGPVINRLSGLWMAWIARKSKRHLYVQRLHDKYGDFVRTGPNELYIRDASAILPLLGPNGMPKGPGMKGRGFHEPAALIACSDPKEHTRRRRPWNRAFSTPALKDYQPIVARRVSQLVEGLQNQHGTVDLSQWISFFTYDFMGDMAFGGGTDLLRDGDKYGLWKLLQDGLRIAVMYEHVPWLSYYTKRVPNVGNDLVELHKVAFERTAKRYENGSSTKDLFYFLSNEDNTETVSPPRHTVLADGILAVIAGSDTTATTLANMFVCLLSHPEMYKRLQAEVDRYYPPGEDALNPQYHAHMTYLDAIINEAMRLFPAVPSGSLRAPLRGSGGKVLGKHFIPEGTQTRITTWGVHRDARNFTNPTAFWPDRWLIAEGHEPAPPGSFVHNADAFIPFSVGPSNCVGKNLALLEMKMVICLCMQTFEMRFADGWNAKMWEENIDDSFVIGMGQLPVVLQRRD